MNKQSLCAVALVIGAVCAPSLVAAQSAGTWLARVGATRISPDVSSGNLSAPSFAGTQADIGSATSLSGGLTYMLSDHVSLDVPLALPFKHDIVGAGAIANVGKIGETKALPATVLAQYRFLSPTSAFRPYAGAGMTYAKFFSERSTAALSGLTGGTPSNPTTLSVESKFAPTVQVGATMAISDRWALNASYSYTKLKTRTTLSTGQTLDARLDPSSLSLDLVYRF